MENQNHSNSKLPKSLTTVTTFSKTLAMVLFIVLPFLGFYLGFQYSYLLNQTSQPPSAAIQKFIVNPTPSDKTSKPSPTCKPRPACLDATPRCMIAETSDMCPRTTLKISEYGVQIVLTDNIKDAYYIRTTADKGYVYLKVHALDEESQCKKDDSSTAALSRVGKDDINPMNQTKYSDSYKGITIGNYFYYIDLAQYSCAESSAGKILLEKVRTAFANAEIIQ